MHEKTLENGPKNSNYLQHMKRVENFLFINGIPGSGKSSAVAKILIDTLRLKHPELKVIALVQDSSRLNSTEDSPSFDKVVGADEAYVTSKFIEDNIYPGIQEDVKSEETKRHSGIDASLPELKSTDKFKNVLFVVDEATFTNEAQ
jgi:excinuclease UvrABC ATPase subunit